MGEVFCVPRLGFAFLRLLGFNLAVLLGLGAVKCDEMVVSLQSASERKFDFETAIGYSISRPRLEIRNSNKSKRSLE